MVIQGDGVAPPYVRGVVETSGAHTSRGVRDWQAVRAFNVRRE